MLTRAWRYGRMIWFIRAEVFPVTAVGTGKPLLCIWKVWKNVDILIRDFNEYSHDIAYSLNRILFGVKYPPPPPIKRLPKMRRVSSLLRELDHRGDLDTSTFWKRINCMQFLYYDMCSSTISLKALYIVWVPYCTQWT